jgi:hypothetical protein
LSVDLASIWDESWSAALYETQQATTYPVDEWRSAGRKTKEWPNGQDLDYWERTGIEQLTAYTTWMEQQINAGWRIATLGDEPAIEFEIRAEFGGVEVLGFADCMYETPDLLLVDYKTGARVPNTFFQLCLYAQAIERQYGVRPKVGAYFMTREGKLSTPEPLDRYGDDYFDRMFFQLAQARQSGPYLPNIGDFCRTCDVAHACYARSGPNAHLYDPDHPQFGVRT